MNAHGRWRVIAIVALTALAALAPWLFVSEGRRPAVLRAARPHSSTAASAANLEQLQQYQERVIAETAIFRPDGGDVNAMFPRFYEYWMEQRANGTDMGPRIFITMNIWSCVYNCKNRTDWEMGPYIHGLDRSYSYFAISGMDKGLHMWGGITPIPADLDILVFHAGGDTRGARNIPIPLLPKSEQLDLKGLAKTTVICAAQWNGSHGIRDGVRETWDSWGEQQGFVWAEGLGKEEYLNLIESSNFTLAPRGNGVSSYRMYEALRMCSIPVYIWKYNLNLPFAELIDWNTVAIVLEVHQLKNLLDTIRNFDVGRAQTQLHRLRHMWTFGYVNDYIVRRLQTEHMGVPIPKAAWSDDPGCDCAPGCGGAC